MKLKRVGLSLNQLLRLFSQFSYVNCKMWVPATCSFPKEPHPWMLYTVTWYELELCWITTYKRCPGPRPLCKILRKSWILKMSYIWWEPYLPLCYSVCNPIWPFVVIVDTYLIYTPSNSLKSKNRHGFPIVLLIYLLKKLFSQQKKNENASWKRVSINSDIQQRNVEIARTMN